MDKVSKTVVLPINEGWLKDFQPNSEKADFSSWSNSPKDEKAVPLTPNTALLIFAMKNAMGLDTITKNMRTLTSDVNRNENKLEQLMISLQELKSKVDELLQKHKK